MTTLLQLFHLEDFFQPQQGTFKGAHHGFNTLLALSSVGLTVDKERANQCSRTRNIIFVTVKGITYITHNATHPQTVWSWIQA